MSFFSALKRVGDFFVYLGRSARNDVCSIVCNIDLLLMSSRTRSPFFRGFSPRIGQDLITDPSQDIGSSLCSQNKGLDHCGWDLTQDTSYSPRHTFLFVFLFGDLNNVCSRLTQSLKIDGKLVSL